MNAGCHLSSSLPAPPGPMVPPTYSLEEVNYLGREEVGGDISRNWPKMFHTYGLFLEVDFVELLGRNHGPAAFPGHLAKLPLRIENRC